jgi:hypothetical protein
MPKYKYIVINEENQQLSGTIDSPDQESARKELNELGFSVVSMQELTAEELAAPAAEAEEGLTVFEFGAIDKNKKNVVGTIQSQDRMSAYKRLISEYGFEVQYIIDNSLAESQKMTERAKGIFDLAQQLDEEEAAKKKKVSGEEKDLIEFERKQQALDAQIEFVLGKVNQMLDMYEADIKPETKKEIKKLVDKILRIRRSTNLEYIRKSAEELLTYLQEKEIFLHEEAKRREKIRMMLEAKNMMRQLKQTRPSANIDIGQKLRHWKEDNITNNPNPSVILKAIDVIITPLIGEKPENPEIEKLKTERGIMMGQIKEYAQMYFQTPEPEHKKEIKEILKNLWGKQKELKKKIKLLEEQEALARAKAGEATIFEKMGSNIMSFCGYLLFFYMIYYFISIYATTKAIGIGEVPFLFYIYKSAFLKYFLVTLFLIYGALSIKDTFFKVNKKAHLFITPITVIIILVIYINL